MKIYYTDDLRRISPKQLQGFFADWPNPPSAETHLKILKNSFAVWLALKEEHCIGFVNAISDGVFYSFIPLLEVLPEYRGKGIGSELIRLMLKTLESMYAVDLVCDESIIPFYENFKFNRAVGMIRRNYQNQNGVV